MKRSGFALPSFVLAATALLVAAVAFAQPGSGPHGRHGGGPPAYDLAAEKVVRGTVAEVKTQGCACAGVHLKLTTESGELEVGLGPGAFLASLGATFAAGDEVEVTGAAPKNEAPADFLARIVRKGETGYELRDAEGQPRWAATGMACPRMAAAAADEAK